MHHDKAFTLIELLVVIAIIAILSVVVVLTLNPAMWVNLNSFAAGYLFDSSGLLARLNGGSGSILYGVHGGSQTAPYAMQAGSWAHLAFEWTSTSLVTYANGQLVNTAAGTGIGLFNYLHFGNGDIGTISGLISDVRIYNRALSAAQIAAMYNGGK